MDEQEHSKLSRMLGMLGNFRWRMEDFSPENQERIAERTLKAIYREFKDDFGIDNVSKMMMYKEHRGYKADDSVVQMWKERDDKRQAEIVKILKDLDEQISAPD